VLANHPFDELELLRLQPLEYDDSGRTIGRWPGLGDVAPLVEGTALAVSAWRDGIVGPGLTIPYEVIAPPSLHWLGGPDPQWSGPGGVVFITMDGSVGDPLPGGLRALMAFTEDVVTWRIVDLVAGKATGSPSTGIIGRSASTVGSTKRRSPGCPQRRSRIGRPNSRSTSSGGPPSWEIRRLGI
jgi:hypothetical protein